MNVAIVGAGFTGLSAAFFLSKQKHKITVFEKEDTLGGLSQTFRLPAWKWSVEKHYHHWFANDESVLTLIKQLNLGNKLLFPKTITCLYHKGKQYPFDDPISVLTFPYLSFPQRLRTGIVTFLLKLLPALPAINLEKYNACSWLKKYYGEQAYRIIWEPLLWGKFGKYAKEVNTAWFWARIKKRTPRLGYLEGGYQTLLSAIASVIEKNNCRILPGKSFDPLTTSLFDKVIITVPSPVFMKMYPRLPSSYKQQLGKIIHLDALSLLLTSKDKILTDCYWLNILERNYPFIALIQHTNLVDSKYYANQHLTWVANYLPANHPYFKLSKEELFGIYLPFLKRINPNFDYQSSIVGYQLFRGLSAQPVFPIYYSRLRPDFKTPIPNVYLANMDMVYPWDRGTNYAIELGRKVAEFVQKD